MCGRAYQTYSDEELALRYLNQALRRRPLGELMSRSNYNLSPTQLSPVVLIEDGATVIKPHRWGLVPAWAKDVASAAKYSMINARSEEIESKRSYSGAFKSRRCILPLSGFFEWQRLSPQEKRPFAIYLKDDPIMSVAGVYEHWESPSTGEVVDSFAILTTAANAFMAKIHDRMPVILDRKDEAQWLDPSLTQTESLRSLLRPCDASLLAAHEVSKMVNSPKNNHADILKPLNHGAG